MTSSDDANSTLDVTAALAELASISLATESLASIMERISAVAKRAVPGVCEASVTLLNRDRPSTVAFTGWLAIELDESQYERGYGPCLDAARTAEVIPVDDMPTEGRWADYPRVAVERGCYSSLSAPLPIADQVVGALNLYSGTPRAFDDEARDLAVTFTRYAAVAVANAFQYETTARLAEDLRRALDSRATIEQAKGILMAQRGCDADEAFHVLTQFSQHTHRKLRDIAATVVEQARQQRGNP
jgi:GAF domain-containing protein